MIRRMLRGLAGEFSGPSLKPVVDPGFAVTELRLAGEFSGPSLKRGPVAGTGPRSGRRLAGEFSGPSLKLRITHRSTFGPIIVWPENSPALH